jgi:hypothetical protein
MDREEKTLSRLLGALSVESTTKGTGDSEIKAPTSASIQSATKLSIDGNKETQTSSAFHAELKKTKFTIFAPLSDYGYFGWNPGDKMTKMKALSTIQADEFKDHIDYGHKPLKLVDISQVRLPQRFHMYLPPLQHPSLYPFGQYYVASLHVATQHRDVLLKDFDFVFGGSTLEMLAKRDASEPFKAVRIPCAENAILLVNCKQYIADYSEVGYQFIRLMTGLAMDCLPDSVTYSEHLHSMRIGDKYNVLFCTVPNAIDENGEPVKISTRNPRYWGTKTMFQMISTGCPILCHGVKGRAGLVRINRIRLAAIAQDAFNDVNYRMLENNILIGMKSLKEHLMNKPAGQVFSVSFNRYGTLEFIPMTGNSIVLPQTKVVKELILNE